MWDSFYNHTENDDWKNINIKYRESFYPPVSDFHEHNYYEINFIVSGNVKVFLPDQIDDGVGSRIIITAPHTPHFVTCKPDVLYKRFYLLFSKEFIEELIPKWNTFLKLFNEKGKVLTVSPAQQEFCKMMIVRLQQEVNPLRQRLILMYLLSFIDEFENNAASVTIPSYIMQAMIYIEEHYKEKIIAESLANTLHVGRTTLMTNFKKYTNFTLNHYITQCRLKKAIILLYEGKTESEIAEKCGFSDTSGLIRSFKRFLGMTPREYINSEKKLK